MENKDKQVAEGAGEQVQVDAEHQEELSVNNDLGYNPNDQQVFNEEVAEGNVDEEERVQVYNELLQELRRLELQEELRRLNNSVRNGLGLIFPILTSSSSDGTSSSTSSFSSTTSSLSSEGNREEQYLRAQQARLQAARNEEFYYRVGSCFILLCSALIALLAIIAFFVFEIVHVYQYGEHGSLVEIGEIMRWFLSEVIVRLGRFLRSFRY